jgi:enediyne polyketide synthase
MRRPDGKPTCCEGGPSVSVTHAGDLSAAVVGKGLLACDLEIIAGRSSEMWNRLLGSGGLGLARRITAEVGDDPDTAATRVWVALECVKKAGLGFDTPLVLGDVGPDRWIRLTAGSCSIYTLAAKVRDVEGGILFGTLCGAGNEVF